ncbi:hypothetical protein GCM10012285_41080 [Streptomyces kronopolitis]|uniref:Uncharacterized protein n=1 Tax=Streptomyces kronopolitis TaxID=1612435 RepID=A0ABQ2JQ92_9ACTN|nr:hypothetical protein [Streptomyces kronopolitis]GGN51211.1 hypothetical protein GCM10012285_41080 [Streptomyces kronopolitis]
MVAYLAAEGVSEAVFDIGGVTKFHFRTDGDTAPGRGREEQPPEMGEGAMNAAVVAPDRE